MANKKINKLAQESEARRRAFEQKQAERGAKAVVRKRDNRLAVVIAIIAVVVALGASFGRQAYNAAMAPTPTPSPTETSSPQPTQTSSVKVPDKALSENRTWNGQMMLNVYGVNFILDGKSAPQAVANFVDLTKKGFYRGISCHRITTKGIYVLQCGDPAGNGSGGPGYSFGPIENAPSDDTYKAGTIAMARVGGDAQSQGSQFFIVYQDSKIPSDTAGGYTVFGQVTQGLDKIVNNIVSKGVSGGGTDGAPSSPVAITFISVK